MAPKIKLTYFNIEGAAEPVRLALALAGLEYEDDRVAFDQWKDLKPTMPFGQLPVLKVNDGPLQTQSMAMLRWVGTQDPNNKLYANMYDVEEALGVIDDFKNSWTPCLYMTRNAAVYGHNPESIDDAAKKDLVKNVREYWMANTLPNHAKNLEKLLAKHNNAWMASMDSPTIADCVAVAFLRSFTKGHIDHVPPAVLDQFPALVEYVKRFCALVPGRYTDGLHE